MAILGVDVGGTFTDAVLLADGELHTAKVPTRPAQEASVFEVGAALSTEVQQVLEALGRDERRSRALPLEQRVRRDGRPVPEPVDGRVPGRLEHEPRRLEHGRLLRGTCRHLCRVQLTVREQHRVRERPADVDPENRHQPVFRKAAAIPAIERSSGRSASGSPAR